MSYYRTCPHCGAHLDPGEACDCFAGRYALLTDANRQRLDAFVCKLATEQEKEAARGATNTTGGKAEKV